jgi:hypothetical protein
MLRKSSKLFTLSLLIIVPILAFYGCGKSGNKFQNQEPDIVITSFEGFDDSDLLAPYANTEFLFQQKIYWNATDPDGVITGFAYRVMNEDGNPVATPGNHYVDMTGDITPQNVLDRFGPGWVMHYMPNANANIPLDDPAADRTIWTSAKYAVINFPAADANGNPLTTLSTFEVIAVDNRGDITPVYTPVSKDGRYNRSKAWRSFKATSARPKCNISTTRGDPDGAAVGAGIRLNFFMEDFDPFIPDRPYKYEFRISKIDPDTGDLIAGTQSEWYNSVTANDPAINQFLLTKHTTPSIQYDFDDQGTLLRRTKVEARVYDMAGVVSIVDTTTAITFAVKPGFRPKTMFYNQKVYALGDNHFIDYTDESLPEILPFTFVQGTQRFATPFFRDTENKLSAITSHNTKVWIRWGWRGEYGQVATSGEINFTDNPYDKKVDHVKDRATDVNYFSEITHFDLRLDGEPYFYAPFPQSVHGVHDAETGKDWLRIPLYSPLGQTVVLTALDPGEHTFEVRCVDLQGEADPIPAEIKFSLVPLVPAANRSGILVIDDDFDNSASPDATVDAKYANMIADFTGTKDFLKRATDTYMDIRDRRISSTTLQPYKLVIYHCDNPFDSGNLKAEHDALSMYIHTGGNVMVSHTAQLSPTLQDFANFNQKTFLSYFGLPFVGTPASMINPASASNLNQMSYFQKAIGQNTYPDVNLAFEEPNPSFNTIVNLRKGLSSVAYFADSYFAATPQNVTYRMGIKPVNYPTQPPTQADYDRLNNRIIGIRRVGTSSKCYLFGFPLSYMVDADAKAAVNKVLAEVM